MAKSSDSFSTVQPIVNAGDRGCIVLDLETIIIEVLLTLNFIPNLDEVRAQGLSYCNSNAGGWYNSYQSGVIGITDQLILQNGKKLRGVQEEQ